MTNRLDWSKRWKEIRAWHLSPEFTAICDTYIEACARLAEQTEEFLEMIPKLRERVEKETARTEYAVGGDIHRGWYCPSPVYDIFVGNVHRGRILKRVSAKSKITNKYAFSSDNQLLCAEEFVGNAVRTEYILDKGDVRYGITVDQDMQLSTFSIETYQDTVLQSYTLLRMATGIGQPICATLEAEKYHYSNNMLMACDCQSYDALVGSFRHSFHEFERVNGNLSAYILHDLSLPEHLRDAYSVRKYRIKANNR